MNDPRFLKAKQFDYEDLNQRLMGNPEVIRQILSMTREYLETLDARLNEALRFENLEKLRKLGHSLKGIAASASMFRLSELGSKLQGITDQDKSGIAAILEEIRQEARSLLKLIAEKGNE